MNLYDVYPLYDMTPVRGEGVYIFDKEGEKFLDLYGGHAVISIGHSHPHYVNRIANQLNLLGFYSNSLQNPLQEALAEMLGSISGYRDYQLFLVNSGAEANENAIKLASFATGMSEVICFKGGFHGRTSGALEVTDNPKIKAPINKNWQVTTLEINDIDQVEDTLKREKTCAVIIEGIQGISGIIEPDSQFLQDLQELCQRYQVKLILDEIQSGYGRTGKFFAHQFSNLEPHLITVAKGMGNGFPIGGVLINPEFKAHYGQLGTTFGGNHLACAAGLAVLEVIEDEGLLQNASEMGQYLIGHLTKIPSINSITGKGLMLGLHMGFPVKNLRKHLLVNEKILVGSSSDPQVLRLLPPLCLSRYHIDVFLESLTQSLKHEELLIP